MLQVRKNSRKTIRNTTMNYYYQRVKYTLYCKPLNLHMYITTGGITTTVAPAKVDGGAA